MEKGPLIIKTQLKMANSLPENCNICSHRIKRHEKTINCTLCLQYSHTQCLPTYMDFDIEYASEGSNLWTCPICLKELFPFNLIEEDAEVLEACSTPANHDINLNTLNSMIYDPFNTLDDDGEDFFDDIDPDQNYLREFRGSTTKNCKYFYSSKLLDELTPKLPKIELALIHLNIRSTPKNFNTFVNTLHATGIDFNMIALTETWLRPSNSDCYGIPNFNHECLTRGAKAGGGVSIYLKSNWNYKIRHDLIHNDNDVQMLWLEIDKDSTHSKTNIILGATYRRPGSDIQFFNSKLQAALSIIQSENKISVHTGDYNLNLLNSDNHPPTNEFTEINFEHSFFPHINKPTRITNSTATLIDNIFTNIPDTSDSNSGILLWDISDHFPIFYIQYKLEPHIEDNYRIGRPITEKNKKHFSETLLNLDWSPVTSDTDTQSAYTKFHDIISKSYNSSFPLKKSKIGYSNKLPWLTSGLKNQ